MLQKISPALQSDGHIRRDAVRQVQSSISGMAENVAILYGSRVESVNFDISEVLFRHTSQRSFPPVAKKFVGKFFSKAA